MRIKEKNFKILGFSVIGFLTLQTILSIILVILFNPESILSKNIAQISIFINLFTLLLWIILDNNVERYDDNIKRNKTKNIIFHPYDENNILVRIEDKISEYNYKYRKWPEFIFLNKIDCQDFINCLNPKGITIDNINKSNFLYHGSIQIICNNNNTESIILK